MAFEGFWYGSLQIMTAILSSIVAIFTIGGIVDRLLSGRIKRWIRSFFGIPEIEATMIGILYDMTIVVNGLSRAISNSDSVESDGNIRLMDTELVEKKAREADNVWKGEFIRGRVEDYRDTDPRYKDEE